MQNISFPDIVDSPAADAEQHCPSADRHISAFFYNSGINGLGGLVTRGIESQLFKCFINKCDGIDMPIPR